MRQQRSAIYWLKASALLLIVVVLVFGSIATSVAIAGDAMNQRKSLKKRERDASAGARAARKKLDEAVFKLKAQEKATSQAKLNLASFKSKNAKSISAAKSAMSQAQECDLKGALLYTVTSASSVGVPCDQVKGLFNRDRLASNAELAWVGDQPNLRTAGYACDTVKTENYEADHTVRVSCVKGTAVRIDVVYDSSQVDAGSGSDG